MTGGRPARVAVAGAGLIGRRHIEEIAASSAAELAAIVAGGPVAGALARGAFYAPTLLEVADSRLPIVREETFGPVASMFRMRRWRQRSCSP